MEPLCITSIAVIFYIVFQCIGMRTNVIVSRDASTTCMCATEKIVFGITHLRVAPVPKINDTPIIGGAAPCAAPTLRKRGPPALRTGLGGRLPTWTLYNLQLGYMYTITTPGTCCATGPAARRAPAMARLASAMAMAPVEVMMIARSVVVRSRPKADSTPAQATNLTTMGLTISLTTADGTGVKVSIGPYTPGHTGVVGILTGTYSVNVCRPAWVALGTARS